jgi:adenylate cyclase
VGIRLGRFYLAAVVGLAALLAALFSVVLDASRRAVARTADELRRAAVDKVAAQLDATFGQAAAAIDDLEAQLHHGLVDPTRADALEAALFAELLRQPQLAEVAMTFAVKTGYAAAGAILLAPEGRGQIAVGRDRDGKISTRFAHPEDGAWVLDVRQEGGRYARSAEAVTDPTEEPTFQSPASRSRRGEAVWTDLYYIDPESKQRKAVGAQKALDDARGGFAGVVRARLLADGIFAIGKMRVTAEKDDPHRIFLCDHGGRLITPLGDADRPIETDDEELRFVHEPTEPAIRAALADPRLDDVTEPLITRVDGQLVSITALPEGHTRGWRVGVAVPERYYLGPLEAARDRVLLIAAMLAVCVLAGGALSLRLLRGGLGQVVREAGRMRRFEFGASSARATFTEVNEVLGSLEVAKTALRAMGRYVPIELVRLLYRDGREPALGGAATDVSLLFSDIKDFTNMSETLPPDRLAEALGQYLEVVGAAIHETGGTIDKFIGDAVMVLWNAPVATPEHARRACRAALGCVAALRDLYASEHWAGGQPWVTRFGLHRDTVLVGHFGAPDRMAFTAIGDGVNLASRIEGLNKVYGTTILVSETIRAAAGDDFVFRRVDRVAVKGKSRAIELHELVGLRGACAEDGLAGYEHALEAYLAGRFAEALERLEAQPAGDGPSRVLGERCRRLLEEPPEAWDGVYRAETK